jgi:hypothetical protein
LTSTRGRFGCRGEGPADGEKITAASIRAGTDRGNSLNQTEEIQTPAPLLCLRICPAMGNARSINANYICGGVNEFSNPLPSILKQAAYHGMGVRQLGINVKDVIAYSCRGTEQNRKDVSVGGC